MKLQIMISASLVATVLLFLGCAKDNPTSTPKTQLSIADVIWIAEDTAKAQGYDITK